MSEIDTEQPLVRGRVFRPRTHNGLSLMELVIVLVIVGILAAVAIPLMQNLKREAKTAVEQQVVGVVRVGINNYFIESISLGRFPRYPELLDNASYAQASKDNPLFTEVLEAGVVVSDWSKLNDTDYSGYSGDTYRYDSTKGLFNKVE